MSSLSNRPAAAPALATSAPPDDAVGFALGKPISAAETRCTTANLDCQSRMAKLDSGKYTCGGPAVDQGMPLKITLSECEGLVCELSADADEAAWNVLVARFGLLSETLKKRYGQFERKTRALEGCADGLQRCFAAGRARTSIAWRWANRQVVSLELDGGQSRKATLVLHYGTSEPVPPT